MQLKNLPKQNLSSAQFAHTKCQRWKIIKHADGERTTLWVSCNSFACVVRSFLLASEAHSLVAFALGNRERMQFCKYRMKCAWCTESEIFSLAVYISALVILLPLPVHVVEELLKNSSTQHFSLDFMYIGVCGVFLPFLLFCAISSIHRFAQPLRNWLFVFGYKVQVELMMPTEMRTVMFGLEISARRDITL